MNKIKKAPAPKAVKKPSKIVIFGFIFIGLVCLYGYMAYSTDKEKSDAPKENYTTSRAISNTTAN